MSELNCIVLFFITFFFQGNNCEKCIKGYYGKATTGQPDDCKECACPGGLRARNQFATQCTLDTDNKPTCGDCLRGYAGRQCEICRDGYYGNPMVCHFLKT